MMAKHSERILHLGVERAAGLSNNRPAQWCPSTQPAIQGHAVRALIENSGFFVPAVSVARMAEIISGHRTTRQVVVGSGCVHTHGVSAGVPVDTIAFYSAAALVAKASGLKALTVLIAPEIAKANGNIDLNDPATSQQLSRIESWHKHIANKFKDFCENREIRVNVVTDRDLMATACYASARIERSQACAGIDTDICPYSEWQDLIFRTLHKDHEAGIKVGWTPHSDASI